jgi:acetylornithine/succinyldiaminopimelate/putrescine aminotransferase
MQQRQLFLQHIAQTSPSPLMLEIEKAEGVYLYGIKGKRYIDFISGISVSNVGHCHPAVVEAIQNQASRFMHLMVYGEYVYSPQVQLAKKLTEILPPTLDNYYFTNSGTEAMEGALKLAKRYTQRSEIISFKNAYHGSTAGALSIMGSEEYKQRYRPLIPNHRLLSYLNEAELDQITSNTAAVVIEIVQAEAGIIPGTSSYLQAVKRKCHETGALLIVDEIQTGCGRTGTMWAFEQVGIVPDILLIGKGFGGGMPIAAFIANKMIMSCLSEQPILGHITTFGGNPVCCAAALATLNVLSSELLTQVESKGAYLESQLNTIGFKDIRRKGLMMSVEMDTFEQNLAFTNSCIESGLIVDWFLFNNSRMRIGPPLTITFEEIDEALTILKNVYSTFFLSRH